MCATTGQLLSLSLLVELTFITWRWGSSFLALHMMPSFPLPPIRQTVFPPLCPSDVRKKPWLLIKEFSFRHSFLFCWSVCPSKPIPCCLDYHISVVYLKSHSMIPALFLSLSGFLLLLLLFLLLILCMHMWCHTNLNACLYNCMSNVIVQIWPCSQFTTSYRHSQSLSLWNYVVI